MTQAATTWVALLRGIGAATHKVMAMADLRSACDAAGIDAVQTVLATGNLIFRFDADETAIKAKLDQIIAGFGLSNDVFLRTPDGLRRTRDANPFPDAAAARPSHLLVHFLAHEAPPNALADYDGPERVACVGRVLFIDYFEGVGNSRLTPARLQRALGGSGTARNWNTLGKLIVKST